MYGTVLRIIQEIKEAKGHAKHPLIVKYINENALFAKVVEYTLDTSRTFKSKKVKDFSALAKIMQAHIIINCASYFF